MTGIRGPRSIRLPFGETLLLVPWHAVEQGVDLEGARAMAKAMLSRELELTPRGR